MPWSPNRTTLPNVPTSESQREKSVRVRNGIAWSKARRSVNFAILSVCLVPILPLRVNAVPRISGLRDILDPLWSASFLKLCFELLLLPGCLTLLLQIAPVFLHLHALVTRLASP